MTIHVIPIPSTIEFSDAAPTSVTLAAQTASAGAAVLAQRGDHLHGSVEFGDGDVVGPGSSVDDAITRYSGTTGKLVQSYSSLSPTISDAGQVTLTSGQLIFPGTELTAASSNTLNDYETGTFTPGLADSSHAAGGGYANQVGFYTKIGNMCYATGFVAMNSITGMTGANQAEIVGFPFSQLNTASGETAVTIGQMGGLSGTQYANVVATGALGEARFILQQWNVAAGTTNFTVTNMSASGIIRFAWTYRVR